MANQHAIIFKIFSNNPHVVKKAQFLSFSITLLLNYSVPELLNLSVT